MWDPGGPGWVRPGLPFLSHLSGRYQPVQTAVWDAWRAKVCFYLCRRQGFRDGPGLDIAGSLQLLNASHVRDRDKALIRGVFLGVCVEWISLWPGQRGVCPLPFLWCF